jgi:glycosyltransferase involved in cell wall biosynthesis
MNLEVPSSHTIDGEIFNSSSRKPNLAGKPVLVCVSSVTKDENLDAFCALETTGTKILVGDGAYLTELKQKYTDVIYTGNKSGIHLARYYANADVLVFTSKNAQVGTVILESIACGTPVAAYPVTGPLHFINAGINGYLDNDLAVAIEQCLLLDRATVEQSSKDYK